MTTFDARPSAFTQLSSTSDWEALFSAAGVQDGIDGSQASAMTPSLDTGGRNAVIQAGNALIRGQLWRCDAAVSTSIPAASAQNRIDRLVLRLNRVASTSPTVVQPVVITGTPSGSPSEPPLTQTPTGIYDIPISSWTSTSAGALTSLVDERQFCIDVWHDMRPCSAGWTGSIPGFYPPQYRKTPDGQHVELYGTVQLGSPYTGVNVFANPLPSSYRPSKSIVLPIALGSNGTSNLTTTPSMVIHGDGTIVLANFPTGLAGTNVYLDHTYPLDPSGLIQS